MAARLRTAQHDDELTALVVRVRGSFSTVEERTRAFIRDAILQGIFRPGQRLQQDAIARLLGVSRMPVRASLRQLESEGLVTFHPHRGATVTALTVDQLAQLYELRILLETFALDKAMLAITPEGVAELEAMATQMERTTDPRKWLEERQRFYGLLYSFAGRPETLALIRRLRASAGPYLLLRRVVAEPHPHLGVVEHVRSGDRRAASSWLASHLEKVSLELQQVIRDEDLMPEPSTDVRGIRGGAGGRGVAAP